LKGAGAGTCQAVQHPGGAPCAALCGALAPMWDEARVAALSAHPGVVGVVAVGTVLAAELRPPPVPSSGGGGGGSGGGNCDGGARTGEEGASGYLAGGAAGVVAGLRARGVFARPLGNTVYLMVTPTTDRRECARLLGALEAAIGDHWPSA
jgi:dethiobiotin synthetase/adenosylmethionine--8-amino-7-oxononanoate aminotransferase